MARVGAVHQQDTRYYRLVSWDTRWPCGACTHADLGARPGRAVADCHATITRAELHCQRTITPPSHPATRAARAAGAAATRVLDHHCTITRLAKTYRNPITQPSPALSAARDGKLIVACGVIGSSRSAFFGEEPTWPTTPRSRSTLWKPPSPPSPAAQPPCPWTATRSATGSPPGCSCWMSYGGCCWTQAWASPPATPPWPPWWTAPRRRAARPLSRSPGCCCPAFAAPPRR